MKLTLRLATAFIITLTLAAPITGRADSSLADELLDSTHDLRAQAELKQEIIPSWEAPIADSLSVVNGGSPFTQGVSAGGYTIEDSTTGLDVGSTSHHRVTSLEDLSEE